MKCIKNTFKILMIAFLLLIFASCQDFVDYDYQLTCDDAFIPDASCQLILSTMRDGVVTSDISLNNDFTFTVLEGGSWITLNEKTLEVTISSSAPIGTQIRIQAVKGDKQAVFQAVITKIDIEKVTLTAPAENVYVGHTAKISGSVLPANATFKTIEYKITEGSEYADINSDTGEVSVHLDAVSDAVIKISGTADGVVSNVISLVIKSIGVESVTLSEKEDRTAVPQGGRLEFAAAALPEDASYPAVTYTITSGGIYGSLSEDGILDIYPDAPVGSVITLKATADGIESELYTVTVEHLSITGVSLHSDRASVEINGTANITATVMPYAVHGISANMQIIEGGEFASLTEGVLKINYGAPSGGIVKIVAWAEDEQGEIENTRSNILEINVYKIEVTGVTLRTSDNTLMVNPGEKVLFNVLIAPANATEQKVQYIISNGLNYASIDKDTGELTVLKNNEDGEVSVLAVVDGRYSNTLTLSTAKYYYPFQNTNWDVFDSKGEVFLNYRNIRINIKDMPENACLKTVVIPNTVRRLVIEGAYSSASPVTTKNLFFYFHKAGNIDLTLINAGIEITECCSNNVFDFPDNSSALIQIQGECHISAGASVNPYFYSIDGVYDTSDEKFVYRKNGMDGNNAANGGIAISGNNIEITGPGSLFVKGGDGAHGSNGGKGADLPPDAQTTPPYSISGNGGSGGCGGNGGYAIYANNITVDMSASGLISAMPGKAGRGGAGGARGQSIPGCSYGTNGAAGIHGKIVSAIAAYNTLNILNGYVYQTEGSLNSECWVSPPEESLNELIIRMERSFGVDMHIKDDLYSPYKEYPMTQLHDDQLIFFMLRLIDNVLSKYPDNIFLEIYNISGKQINIYVVNTIKAGSVAGLASSANNIWLSYNATNIRNIFYSNVENFAFHELTHIIQYNASGYFSEAAMRAFNATYDYVSTGNLTGGVYNLENGFRKDNSYFLSSYSRKSWQEDMCETLSLIARQSRDWDFLNTDMPIRKKMVYIAACIENGYETASNYKEEYWERFLPEDV